MSCIRSLIIESWRALLSRAGHADKRAVITVRIPREIVLIIIYGETHSETHLSCRAPDCTLIKFPPLRAHLVIISTLESLSVVEKGRWRQPRESVAIEKFFFFFIEQVNKPRCTCKNQLGGY